MGNNTKEQSNKRGSTWENHVWPEPGSMVKFNDSYTYEYTPWGCVGGIVHNLIRPTYVNGLKDTNVLIVAAMKNYYCDTSIACLVLNPQFGLFWCYTISLKEL